jgi:hypothetical protein
MATKDNAEKLAVIGMALALAALLFMTIVNALND